MFGACEKILGEKKKEGFPRNCPPCAQRGRKKEKGWCRVGWKESCILQPGEVIENANSVPTDENFEGQVLVIGLLEKQQSRNKNRSLTKNIPFQLRSFKVLLPIFLFKKL